MADVLLSTTTPQVNRNLPPPTPAFTGMTLTPALAQKVTNPLLEEQGIRVLGDLADYEVFKEQNELRQNPTSFLPYLIEHLEKGKFERKDVEAAIAAIREHRDYL
jgi:hypothetical protein